MLGKYLDQFALKQSKGFSCFIQLEGNTDDLHALINQLNKKYFKVPLKYSIYDYGDGKISCQLYGELRSGGKSENVFTDLTGLGNIKKVELE